MTLSMLVDDTVHRMSTYAIYVWMLRSTRVLFLLHNFSERNKSYATKATIITKNKRVSPTLPYLRLCLLTLVLYWKSTPSHPASLYEASQGMHLVLVWPTAERSAHLIGFSACDLELFGQNLSGKDGQSNLGKLESRTKTWVLAP